MWGGSKWAEEQLKKLKMHLITFGHALLTLAATSVSLLESVLGSLLHPDCLIIALTVLNFQWWSLRFYDASLTSRYTWLRRPPDDVLCESIYFWAPNAPVLSINQVTTMKITLITEGNFARQIVIRLLLFHNLFNEIHSLCVIGRLQILLVG